MVVALSAIVFRISSLGITPNRFAVLGGNTLNLIHLLLVTSQLFRVVFKSKCDGSTVDLSDTIEDKIMLMQEAKKDLASDLIKAGESIFKSLTGSDLLVLI